VTLSVDGFSRPIISDLKQQLDKVAAAAFGAVNTGPDSLIGQYNGVISAALDDVWQGVEDNYDSMYPFSAEEKALDGAVSFIGVTRNGATGTQVYAVCYGADGTAIPATSLARADVQYQTDGGEISRLIAIDVQLGIIGLTPATNYQVSINSEVIGFTSSAQPTTPDILAGLAQAINEADVKDGVSASVVGDKLQVRSNDLTTSFSVYAVTGLSITKLGSNVVFSCTEAGAIKLPARALTAIDTPVLGWDSVTNLLAGATGEPVESDQSLRLRFEESRVSSGLATVDAIRSHVLQVAGVAGVRLYENRSHFPTSDGMAPHSFTAVVSGGFDSDIGNMIWYSKGAGIETNGTQQVIVTDSNGDGQPMRFSRAAPVYIWVKVEVLELDAEEVVPADLPGAIAQAVLKAGNKLMPNQDVIVQRFYGPVYAATTGIALMQIWVARTEAPDGVPEYSVDNLPMGRAEQASFDLTRITVTGV
jgi:uncharacterized phage protein gp47/JayE